jgi:hypothetical protein
MESPTLVVLAAGIGGRYGGLKQIDPVGPSGEGILDYSVHDAVRAGFGKVVFIIRREIEAAFREAIGSRLESRIPVEYAFQALNDLPGGHTVPEGRTKPWGTTHAILAARDLVREPFGVINADDFYGPQSFQLLADALRAPAPSGQSEPWVLVGFPLRNTLSEHGTVSRGVCSVDDAGHLRTIEECEKIRPLPDGGIELLRGGTPETVYGTQTVSMNMWGFTPAFFDKALAGFESFLSNLPNPLASEYYIPTEVQARIDSGEAAVRVVQSPESWLGVTYPDDKPAVKDGLHALINRGVYPEKLWS